MIGRCGASCYDAPANTRCACICRGANHGRGRLAAMASARALSESFSDSQVHPEADQMLIPGIETE